MIDIPEGDPVITMYKSYRTIGTGPDYLRIYENGTVIDIEERGLSPDSKRIWRTGQLREEDLKSLLAFFSDSHLESLDGIYYFPGVTVNGTTMMGGMGCTISINHEELHKTVHADRYLSPDSGMTYPGMPYPLNEIYKRLQAIIENEAEEVYREFI